ncbi:substrate-binding domain-containing protein [Pseudoalteromonas sp. MMG013]|uniref:substrate-binding domain-containing protein n=1 Tax=Pseudoalteromonas sp. MMG013 TaxID=2822687 RepID=UPI001B367D40|nr:substrate-binding domain-containing protein [Pseudoalteromonas sp. MMG013]MBQ4861607.1 substrate-binding domain-containing protein [Pseudoalteromonas sp. MMG013]
MILQYRKPISRYGTQIIVAVVLSFLCVSYSFAAVKIAVVGKTKNDSFYEQSYRGCVQFAQQHRDIECIYDGADDYQDVRTQVLIVDDLVKKGIDGLLISTTDSKFLVEGALKAAKRQGIPVITFDSDLLSEHQSYRLAYVGTNNFDFGKALGEVAKKYRTNESQVFCIQSGHQTTPNLNERIDGVRHSLNSGARVPLDKGNTWKEYERCPFYTMGRREDALNQLLAMVRAANPPIFIAVAGFAQFNPRYIEMLRPYQDKIKNRQAVIISADTEQVQLNALRQGLATENVGQNPFQMGVMGAQLLYDVIINKKMPDKDSYFLDFHYCQQANTQTCTVNH